MKNVRSVKMTVLSLATSRCDISLLTFEFFGIPASAPAPRHRTRGRDPWWNESRCCRWIQARGKGMDQQGRESQSHSQAMVSLRIMCARVRARAREARANDFEGEDPVPVSAGDMGMGRMGLGRTAHHTTYHCFWIRFWERLPLLLISALSEHAYDCYWCSCGQG